MKFRKIRKVYLAILFSALLIFIGLIVFDQVFRVQNIVISPLNRSDSKKINSVTGLTSFYQRNLFLVSEEQLKTGIMSTNPHVQSVSVEKRFPQTLALTIGFYSPAAYLKVNGGYFLLAESGNVLEKTKSVTSGSIPTIKYYQQLDYYGFQSGDVIGYKDINTSLQLLTKALDLGFTINNIDINGLSMIVLNSKDKRFLFTTEKDTSEQEYQFSAIIRKFRAEGKDFKTLDLRFDKPVISL